tara:strand:+ start:128110 stop:128760 length:651 start_codon:yes stop_codon:yes gene_type:complete
MGGFNYENNKKNPRIYKNSDEFGMCSLFVKEFRIALRPLLKFKNVGMLHQRLMKLCSKIKLLDTTAEQGSRTMGGGLRTLKGKMLLREFVFTPKAGIRQHFGNPEIDEVDFTLTWRGFDPSSGRFPKGATDFELLYLVLTYDPDVNLFTTYEAIPIRRSKLGKAEVLVMPLARNVKKKEGMHFISVIGLRYLEILGEEEYACLGQDAVGIEILGVF